MSKTAPKCADCHPHCPGYGKRGSCHEELPARPWWEHYFEGVVRRNDETPDDIVSACMDWYDGKRSAMYAFWNGRAVKPGRLASETAKCLADNNQGDAEAVRLRTLELWAMHQRQLCEAAIALREAEAAFSDAAESAQIEPYEVARMREAARAQ